MGPVLLVAGLVLGCGGGGEQPSAPTPEQASRLLPQTGLGETAREERDVSALDVCVLVPAEELAAAVGGEVARPASRSDIGEIQGCTYSIDPVGAAAMETYIVYVAPESYFELSSDPLEEESVEPIDGLGDEAVMKYHPVEHQHSLVVLRRGDVMFEVKTSAAEDARKVALLVLSKL